VIAGGLKEIKSFEEVMGVGWPCKGLSRPGKNLRIKPDFA
jgi:hypothetical protein